jgi:hypothetical protein
MTTTLAPDQRYDWSRILLDLSMHGMTLQAVFEATGIPASTLHGYKNLDAEPRHSDGERLLAFWRGHHEGDAPIISGSIRIDRRVQSDEMLLREKCPSCGQTIRGALLDKWTQLRMHYEQFGGPAPS